MEELQTHAGAIEGQLQASKAVIKVRAGAPCGRGRGLMAMAQTVAADYVELEGSVRRLVGNCEKAQRANAASHKSAAAPGGARMQSTLQKVSKAGLGLGGLVSKFSESMESTMHTRSSRCHNEYVLQLVGTNAMRRRFFARDLPNVLEALQLQHHGVTTAVATLADEAAVALGTMYARQGGKVAPLAQAAAELQQHHAHDLVCWLQGQPRREPAVLSDMPFVPPVDDGGKPIDATPVPIASDELSQADLAKRMQQYEGTAASYRAQLGKATKEIEGLEKLHAQYMATPSFGRPEQVYDQLYKARARRRAMEATIERTEAGIAVLAQAGITPAGPVRASVAVDDMEDWDADDGAQAPPLAVALFDYAAQNDEELSLTAGAVVTVSSWASDWCNATVGAQEGLCPRAYLHGFEGDWRLQVKALYAYEAAAEGELSIAADEMLTIVSEEDDGWCQVHRPTDGQAGMVPAAYLDRNFVHTLDARPASPALEEAPQPPPAEPGVEAPAPVQADGGAAPAEDAEEEFPAAPEPKAAADTTPADMPLPPPPADEGRRVTDL